MPAPDQPASATVHQPAPKPADTPATSNVLVGGSWMLMAGMGFAIMIGIIRHVSAEIHAFEIAFFRNLFGLLWMLPWFLKVGSDGLKTQRIGLYSLRAVAGVAAMLTWFTAVTIMPLTEAVALSFTTPFFATILAILFLGEIVRARRWSAIIVGFIGAMIILRPGIEAIRPEALLVLFSAFCVAAATLFVKMLSRTEHPNAIVAYMVIFLTPISLVPAIFVWRWPSWTMLGWMALLGLIATLSHLCYTRAFRAADTSAIMPFDFSRLLFSALIGFLFFQEIAGIWTWVGAAIIVSAAIYTARREAITQRQGRQK